MARGTWLIRSCRARLRGVAEVDEAYWGAEETGAVGRIRVGRVRDLPRVHRLISVLKLWLLGAHQGAIAHEHLRDHLDEFTFRFNERYSTSRGKLFYRLAQQAVRVDPAPYDTLISLRTEP